MVALRSALAVYADVSNWSLEDFGWVSNYTDLTPNIARKALGMSELTSENYGKLKKAEEEVKPGKNQWKKQN